MLIFIIARFLIPIDYYNDYYYGDYQEFDHLNPPPNHQPEQSDQSSSSANDILDNGDRKRLLKRYGESYGHPAGWSPTTEEELEAIMKYDPYYAQYYYSKYKPQEEGRYVEDESEDFISKKIRNIRENDAIFR